MASMTCGEKFLDPCLQPDSLIIKSAWSVLPHGAQKRSSLLPTASHSHALQWCNITMLASSVWQGLEQTSGLFIWKASNLPANKEAQARLV